MTMSNCALIQCKDKVVNKSGEEPPVIKTPRESCVTCR